jgi:hypothetical protein
MTVIRTALSFFGLANEEVTDMSRSAFDTTLRQAIKLDAEVAKHAFRACVSQALYAHYPHYLRPPASVHNYLDTFVSRMVQALERDARSYLRGFPVTKIGGQVQRALWERSVYFFAEEYYGVERVERREPRARGKFYTPEDYLKAAEASDVSLTIVVRPIYRADITTAQARRLEALGEVVNLDVVGIPYHDEGPLEDVLLSPHSDSPFRSRSLWGHVYEGGEVLYHGRMWLETPDTFDDDVDPKGRLQGRDLKEGVSGEETEKEAIGSLTLEILRLVTLVSARPLWAARLWLGYLTALSRALPKLLPQHWRYAQRRYQQGKLWQGKLAFWKQVAQAPQGSALAKRRQRLSETRYENPPQPRPLKVRQAAVALRGQLTFPPEAFTGVFVAPLMGEAWVKEKARLCALPSHRVIDLSQADIVAAKPEPFPLELRPWSPCKTRLYALKRTLDCSYLELVSELPWSPEQAQSATQTLNTSPKQKHLDILTGLVETYSKVRGTRLAQDEVWRREYEAVDCLDVATDLKREIDALPAGVTAPKGLIGMYAQACLDTERTRRTQLEAQRFEAGLFDLERALHSSLASDPSSAPLS